MIIELGEYRGEYLVGCTRSDLQEFDQLTSLGFITLSKGGGGIFGGNHPKYPRTYWRIGARKNELKERE